MNMCNLTEHSANYLLTPGRLWLYYRDQTALENNGNIIDFPANDFKYLPRKTAADKVLRDKTFNIDKKS